VIPPLAAVCESCANSVSDQTVNNTEGKNASTAIIIIIIIQTVHSMCTSEPQPSLSYAAV